MQTTFRQKALAAIFAVFSSVLLMSGSVLAQTQATSGQITGTVVDQSGAVVANATITATNTATGFKQTTTSNGDGEYRLVQLPPGEYNVTAEGGSFQPVTVEKVTVLVGRAFELKLTLGVSGTSDVVEVTASGVAVQTARSEADSIQNATAIQNLPINGRRFQDFITLSPNAQVEPRRNQISLSGQRGVYGANVNVDGMDYNQAFFGGIRGGERSNTAFTIPQESIREFQVISSGYSAEFGRSTGGIVNAVTKSGTNQFHGSAFYLIRPQDTARSNEYFDLLDANNRVRGINSPIIPAPTQQQFGGSVGGPIVKDKLFFFFAYEQQRLRQTRSTVFTTLGGFTPTAASQEGFNFFVPQQGNFQQTNDSYAPFARIDWNINSKNTLAVRYNFGWSRAENANSNGVQIQPNTDSAISNNGNEYDRNNVGVVQFNTTFTPTLFNEFRYQFAREDRPRTSNSSLPLLNVTNVGRFGAVNFLPTTQYDTRNQFVDNVTWLKGNHSMKFGFEYSRVFANQLFGFNQFGNFFFQGLAGSGNTLTENALAAITNVTRTGYFGRFDTTTARYQYQLGNRFAEFTVHQLAFYGQDSWKIRPNFTLNYGLRWEGQYNPTPEANNSTLVNAVSSTQFPIDIAGKRRNPGLLPDVTDQFAPRVGIAWDPFNNGKSVFRANAGYFYATTPLLLFAASVNNFRTPFGDVSTQFPYNLPTGFSQAAFDANPATAGYRAVVGTGVTPNTVYRQLLLAGINLNASSLGNLPVPTQTQINSVAAILGVPQTSGLNLIFTADDFKNPRAGQVNFGYEYEVSKGFTVGVDFSYIKTVYLQRNRDLNYSFPRPNIDNVAGDTSGRPIYGNGQGGTPALRATSAFNQLGVRESTARSIYRAMVLRAKFERKWGQFSAFYTLSDNKSDDDNEREAGGSFPADSFALASEYGFSNIDRRHQFVVNPIFFLPYGFDVAGTVRLQSGFPINAIVGTDVNRDTVNSDRPLLAPGVIMPRNNFRNRPVYNVDLRIQKGFKFGETRRLVISLEMFNIFNLMNLQLGGSANIFCSTAGQSVAAQRACGLATGAPFNSSFLQLRTAGVLNPNNISGPATGVGQFQFGVRYQF
jgi:outer membrane receptor for ferrienterochelin and colicin